jgi:hypothetical protein
MKIKVTERGEKTFTADDEYTEPGLRHALGLEADRDEEVRAVIYETTDGMRDCERDEYLVITEDDGAPLWSGWLSQHLNSKPAPGEAASSEDLPAPAAAGADASRDHNEMVEEILQNADELEDGGDAPAEVLAVRYVRRLEAARTVLAEILDMAEGQLDGRTHIRRGEITEWRERAKLGEVTP